MEEKSKVARHLLITNWSQNGDGHMPDSCVTLVGILERAEEDGQGGQERLDLT